MKVRLMRLYLLCLVTLAAFSMTAAATDGYDVSTRRSENGNVYAFSSDAISENTAHLQNGENLPKLSTPYDLEWGKFWSEDDCRELPGAGSWTLGALSQNQYRLAYYLKNYSGGKDKQVTEFTWYLNPGEIREGFHKSDDEFIVEYYPAGDYYFTVQALGDGTQYSDSDIATSEIWHYDPPQARIPTVSKPVWANDGYHVTWTPCETEYFYAYYVNFYYAANLEEEPREISSSSSSFESPDWAESEVEDWVFENEGAGYYYVAVRALSSDITKALSSGWSEMSDPLYISADRSTLTQIVSSVTEWSSPEEKQEAVENVREIGAHKLGLAMADDTDNTAAAAEIARLEEITGSRAEINVSDALTDTFDANSVSVIGAGLNADVGESVTLNIGEADPSTVVPTMYANTVQFSMRLENENGQNIIPEGQSLSVPVKLTFPIPDRINPDFLVILHHHTDGSYETLTAPALHTYSENGREYVSFIVYSFSDFTMAEILITAAAERAENGILLTYQLRDDVRTVYSFYAVYDRDGQCLSIGQLTAGQEKNILIPVEKETAETMKFFFLTADYIPVENAAVLQIDETSTV